MVTKLTGLRPEEVAQLEEEPVAHALEILEREGLLLGDAGAVPEIEHRAGGGAVGEQQIEPQVVLDLRVDRDERPRVIRLEDGASVIGSRRASRSWAAYWPTNRTNTGRAI